MDLEVLPVEHSDVTRCVALRVARLRSLLIDFRLLVQVVVHGIFRVLRVSRVGRRSFYHLKVVDPERDMEVLAYAKWELYKQCRTDLEQLHQALTEPDSEEPAEDGFEKLRRAATQYFCSRNDEMGKSPHSRKSPELLSPMCGSEIRLYGRELIPYSSGAASYSRTASQTWCSQSFVEMGNPSVRSNWSSYVPPVVCIRSAVLQPLWI